MNIKEASYNDLRQMFQSTVVRYGKEPVFIHHVNEDKSVDLSFIGNGAEKRINLADKEWDFKPVSLGYVNIQGSCFYLTRRPNRQWKQGLHHDNVKIQYHGDGRPHDKRWMSAYERIKGINCSPLYNTINRIYPSLDEAIDLLQEDFEVAFDRQFAITQSMDIYFKGKWVGLYQNGQISFPPENEYLRKAL